MKWLQLFAGNQFIFCRQTVWNQATIGGLFPWSVDVPEGSNWYRTMSKSVRQLLISSRRSPFSPLFWEMGTIKPISIFLPRSLINKLVTGWNGTENAALHAYTDSLRPLTQTSLIGGRSGFPRALCFFWFQSETEAAGERSIAHSEINSKSEIRWLEVSCCSYYSCNLVPFSNQIQRFRDCCTIERVHGAHTQRAAIISCAYVTVPRILNRWPVIVRYSTVDNAQISRVTPVRRWTKL